MPNSMSTFCRTLFAVVGVAFFLSGCASQPRTIERPNVVFIIADDLNLQIGTFGNSFVHTPNIDTLASRGVVFEQAYSQFPLCAPSRASLMAGLRPSSTGVLDLRTNLRQTMPDVVTLPQFFRQNGYFSARVGKIFHQNVPADIGLPGLDDPLSWDVALNPRGRDKEAENGRLRNLTPPMGFGTALAFLADDGADEEQTDGMVATEAIRLIEARGDSPFFLAVGFYRPHVPEVAPRAYFDLYTTEEINPRRESAAHLSEIPRASQHWLPQNFGLSLEEQREMVRAYYASTSFVDAQIGRVLQALDRQGLTDNTIVVVTSDHGYMLGEHGQWEKNVLWDEATHVPLIVAGPGLRPGRSPGLVELIDIYPTLAGLAGLRAPDGLEGRDLGALLREPGAHWPHAAFSQVNGGRSVRFGPWRYTEWEQGRLGVELYDLATDPSEHNNLARDDRYAPVRAQLRSMLPSGPVEPRSEIMQVDREAGVISWLAWPRDD